MMGATARLLTSYLTFLKDEKTYHEDTKAQRNFEQMLDILHIEIEEPELYC